MWRSKRKKREEVSLRGNEERERESFHKKAGAGSKRGRRREGSKQSKPGPVPLSCQWAAQCLVITLFEMTMA